MRQIRRGLTRRLPLHSCPGSPGNNAAVWVMEGPAQPLSPPHPPAPGRKNLCTVYFKLAVVLLMDWALFLNGS